MAGVVLGGKEWGGRLAFCGGGTGEPWKIREVEPLAGVWGPDWRVREARPKAVAVIQATPGGDDADGKGRGQSRGRWMGWEHPRGDEVSR